MRNALWAGNDGIKITLKIVTIIVAVAMAMAIAISIVAISIAIVAVATMVIIIIVIIVVVFGLSHDHQGCSRHQGNQQDCLSDGHHYPEKQGNQFVSLSASMIVQSEPEFM